MRGAAVLLALVLAGGCAGRVAAPPSPHAAADDGVPLGALPRQTLGKGECGLFLWGASPARLVLVAKSGPPPFARLLLDGRAIDLPRLADETDRPARYGDGRVTVVLDVAVEPREGLSDGAVVRGGSIRIDRKDDEGFVVPVTGLLACG